MAQRVDKFRYALVRSLIREITHEVKSGTVSEESMLGWYLLNRDFPKECSAALKKLPKNRQSKFTAELEKRKKAFGEMKKDMAGADGAAAGDDMSYIG